MLQLCKLVGYMHKTSLTIVYMREPFPTIILIYINKKGLAFTGTIITIQVVSAVGRFFGRCV